MLISVWVRSRAGLFAGDKRQGRPPLKQPPKLKPKVPAPALRREPVRMLGHSDAEEEEYDYGEPRSEPRYGARAPAPAPPTAPRESRPASRLPPRLAPLFELCRPKEGKPASAPAPAPAPRGPLVHPTPARRQLAPIFTRPAAAAEAKVAPVFEPSGRAAADKAAAHWPGKRGLVPAAKRAKPAAAAAGKKPAREPVTNSVVVDRSTGLAYFVHEDGRRSPRQM